MKNYWDLFKKHLKFDYNIHDKLLKQNFTLLKK